MNEVIQDKLANLPSSPGVYLMKNAESQVIYVGKAVNLRNRVRSYFRAQPREAVKTKALVRHIEDFEYIVVGSETEALVLEMNLIKKYKPRYNVNLKDGKTYPYVRITKEDWPRIFVTRHVVRDGSRYFGPYPNVYELRQIINILYHIYRWRTCGKARFNQGEACLNAHIDLCHAPCVGGISEEAYGQMVEEVARFFSGKTEHLEAELQAKMQAASDRFEYEEAAGYRDQLKAIDHLNARQKAALQTKDDRDIVAMARNDWGAVIQVFFVRAGKILGRESYPMRQIDQSSDDEVLSSFLKQFYLSQERVPPTIYIDRETSDTEALAAHLTEKFDRRTIFHVPQRGDNKALVDLVQKNAQEALSKWRLSQDEKKARTEGALADLAAYLDLPAPPNRIECYDISNIQGSDSVASMVVFEKGRPKKDQYRRFKIKTVEGPNDFESMFEVITRRFRHASQERASDKDEGRFSHLPDLVIIDGGKGQLGYARRAMANEGYTAIPTFGLAKQEEILVHEDGSETRIPHDTPALYLIQRIRDESHRFAITYHRSLRGKRQLASILDDIPGIGPKRRQSLLTYFGSFSKIQSAGVEDLAKAPGISPALAQTIHDYLRTHQDLQARLRLKNARP
ncbi:excinuclease ABC subunit UvrC [Peptococcus simiae]|uniref:excinuclease ABC subunit UvrC n=1 Tax=Peptococcus simiae TaxID=1643805 RepID=UPI0039805880